MNSLEGVKVGDVLLRFVTDRRRGNDEGEPVRVTRVGRTLLDVVSVDDRWTRVQTFRIESGVTNDGYGGTKVMTAQQFADQQRTRAAREKLAALGIEFTFRCNFTVNQFVALAAFTEGWA